jgi:hypothetical protein
MGDTQAYNLVMDLWDTTSESYSVVTAGHTVEAWDDQENDEESTMLAEDARELVTYSTDWTVGTIINQLEEGRINISPSFQRRDAWLDSRKSAYIESLILGLPVPQIVLAEDKDRKGHFIVLDGKQRLLSLLKFCGIRPYETEGLKLRDLKIKSELNGRTYHELRNDLIQEDDFSMFTNATIRTVVVRNWKKASTLHAIFLRLNTGSVQLSPQELRQALLPGKFTSYIDEAAGRSQATMRLLKTKKPDYRMRDIEILLRFISLYFFRDAYNGDLKGFMDSTCERFNNNWGEVKDEVESCVELYERTVDSLYDLFDGTPARKYLETGYESRFNRAALDAQLFAVLDVDAAVLAEKKDEIQRAWQELCLTDPQFIQSIESTTKAIGSVSYRLDTWRGKLLLATGA